MGQILRAYGKFIQHPVEFLDGEAFLRGRRRGPVGAQDLKSQRFWFHSTPSGFRFVYGYKFRIEFDGQGHGVLLRSLSAQLCVKRKLQKGAGGEIAQISRIAGQTSRSSRKGRDERGTAELVSDFQNDGHDHGAPSGGFLDEAL
jgi:hypothetical protein